MTAAEFLRAAAALPVATLPEIVGEGGLVVVAPHPDDESLGVGGLLAAVAAAGIDHRVVVLTDGVGSHPNSRLFPPDRLRDLRENETRAALTALGSSPDRVAFRRRPDRFLCAAGPEAEADVDAIVAAAVACRATAVATTWGGDPHCDHEAASAILRLARDRLPAGRRIYEFPVWGWSLPPEREVGAAPRGARLDVSTHRDAKASAIAAHRSQVRDLVPDDPGGFRLLPDVLARFAGPFEILLEAAP